MAAAVAFLEHLMSKVKSLRSLVLSPMSGFRTSVVSVPEWGIDVHLREPSGKAWVEWREIMSDEGEEKQTAAQTAHRNMQADVVLFTDVILDEDNKPVFTDEDREEIGKFYGPVHARLLKQALDLSTSQADAVKK